VSLITLDRELARRIEPRAPTPEARLRAVARLAEAGIDVGVNVMPVLPGITDGVEAMDALVRAVARAGASHIAACALRLRGTARRRYLPFIEAEFPHLADRYRASYAASYNVGERYREGLRRHFAKLCAKYGIRDGFYDDGEDEEEAETGETAGAANPASDRVTTEQLGLEL
jgi:DNA repair photolyase